MIKIHLILLVLLMQVKLSGQDHDENHTDSIQPPDSTSDFALDLFVGKKFFQNTFYDQLNTLNNFSVNRPLTFIGVGYNGGFVVNRDYSYGGHLAFLYIIPQDITVDTNVTGKISGYVFSVSMAGWDFFKKKDNVDLILSFGANLGRIRMFQNERLKQKNPLLAPMVALSPSFKIKKIKLTFNFQYDVDLSRTNWRRMTFSKTSKIPLSRFNQSGFSTFICIGYYY